MGVLVGVPPKTQLLQSNNGVLALPPSAARLQKHYVQDQSCVLLALVPQLIGFSYGFNRVLIRFNRVLIGFNRVLIRFNRVLIRFNKGLIGF